MVVTLATRVIRFLKKRGYFQDDAEAAVPDEEMSLEELLPELQAARIHLTRFFGCLAPRAKIRSQIVPKKEGVSEQSAAAGADAQASTAPKKTRRT